MEVDKATYLAACWYGAYHNRMAVCSRIDGSATGHSQDAVANRQVPSTWQPQDPPRIDLRPVERSRKNSHFELCTKKDAAKQMKIVECVPQAKPTYRLPSHVLYPTYRPLYAHPTQPHIPTSCTPEIATQRRA